MMAFGRRSTPLAVLKLGGNTRRDDCPLWFEFHATYRLRWHAVPQYLSELLGAEVRA